MEALEKLRSFLKEDIEHAVEAAINKRLGTAPNTPVVSTVMDTNQIQQEVLKTVIDYLNNTTMITPVFSNDEEMDEIQIKIANKICSLKVFNKKGVGKHIRNGIKSHEIQKHK
jgi:hypothetical protein